MTRNLYSDWKHSHEEDEPGRMVFRPAWYDFPLSRGRQEILLENKESCTFHDIARGDGLQDLPCRVEQVAGKTYIIVRYGNEQNRNFEIISIDADKLVLVEKY